MLAVPFWLIKLFNALFLILMFNTDDVNFLSCAYKLLSIVVHQLGT